jgi:pilus assembly protein CpaB
VRASTIVMIGFAVLFGLLAVVIAQTWLNSQAEMRMKSLEAEKKPHATRMIVVAAKPLRYGMEVLAPMLREIPWSEESLPTGAFSSVADLLNGGKRVVLAAIEQNEPRAGGESHRFRPTRNSFLACQGGDEGRYHPGQRC